MTESYYRADARQSGKDECLSDIQLAALIDNSLKISEKQRLFKHLNCCENCRFCWMEASISISDTISIQNRDSWRDRLRQLVSINLMPPKLGTGLAIMATLVFCTVLLLPVQKGIEPMLDDQYALLTTGQHSMQAQQAMKKMPLPWEYAGLSFAPAHIDTATLVFAAGLLEGRNTLAYNNDAPLPFSLTAQQHDDWNGAKQPLYYQLGRWMAALWFASQLDNTVDWSRQFLILQQFKSDFRSKRERQAGPALKALQRIDSALKEIQQASYAQDDFRDEVERVMIQLSPVSLGG